MQITLPISGESRRESVYEWGRQEGRVCMSGEDKRKECTRVGKAGGESVYEWGRQEESVYEWGRQEGRVCMSGEGRRGECV